MIDFINLVPFATQFNQMDDYQRLQQLIQEGRVSEAQILAGELAGRKMMEDDKWECARNRVEQTIENVNEGVREARELVCRDSSPMSLDETKKQVRKIIRRLEHKIFNIDAIIENLQQSSDEGRRKVAIRNLLQTVEAVEKIRDALQSYPAFLDILQGTIDVPSLNVPQR